MALCGQTDGHTYIHMFKSTSQAAMQLKILKTENVTDIGDKHNFPQTEHTGVYVEFWLRYGNIKS